MGRHKKFYLMLRLIIPLDPPPNFTVSYFSLGEHLISGRVSKRLVFKGRVAKLGAGKILALPKRGGGLTYAKIFLVDL